MSGLMDLSDEAFWDPVEVAELGLLEDSSDDADGDVGNPPFLSGDAISLVTVWYFVSLLSTAVANNLL